MTAPPDRSIFHFYGYDPRGSRFYDRLLRKNISAQSGTAKRFPATTISRKITPQFTTFNVASQSDGEATSATVSIMRWERFVAETMIRNRSHLVLHGYLLMLRGLINGVCLNLLRMNWKFAGILAGMFFLPTGLALAGCAAFLYAFSDLPAYLHVVGCLVVLALTHLGYWALLMSRMYPWFFLRSMSFYSSVGGLSPRLDAKLPAFDTILDEAAAAIADEMKRYPDREFLLIGHSAGAILSIEVAGRLIERYGAACSGKRLRLITLGGAWAFLAAHHGPRAIRHRQYVSALISSPLIEWADVVAREDVLSVPDTVNRLSRILREPPPKLCQFWYVCPQYPRILTYKYWRRHVLNFVVMHFQYLLTPEIPGRYNYLNFIYNPWGEQTAAFVRPGD